MAVKFTDGFRENRTPQGFFLDETISFSEPTGIADGAVFFELDGVDHAVAIEQVVPRDRLVQGVRSVSDVQAPNAFGDVPGYGEGVLDGVLLHRSEVAGYLDPRVGSFVKRVLALVRN